MKTLNKLIAASLAALSVGNAVALPDVGVINTRVSNILDKIGVDSAGFDAGSYTISGSNDLGNFSTNFTAGTGATAQDIADQINAFNVINTTVYVPVSVSSVNGVRSDGLEDMLLDALAYKLDEITGDVGYLVSSFADGKLAFETALNSGVAIIAPASVDYANADAQTWFGVKNSLDIFTASANAWTAGIRELNGDMDNDGVRDTGRVSHFDADVVVGTEVASYASDQDVTSDVGLIVKTFATDSTESSVFLDLGTSYDREKLAAASVAAGSTTISERNAILSGQTIFSAARHENDTTGYAALILGSFDATTITTTSAAIAPATIQVVANSSYGNPTGTYTWKEKYAGGPIEWIHSDGYTVGSLSTTELSEAGVLSSYGSGMYSVSGFVAAVTTQTTSINAGALDSIKNSEIKGYATELLTNTVDTSSPQWLQDLAGI